MCRLLPLNNAQLVLRGPVCQENILNIIIPSAAAWTVARRNDESMLTPSSDPTIWMPKPAVTSLHCFSQTSRSETIECFRNDRKAAFYYIPRRKRRSVLKKINDLIVFLIRSWRQKACQCLMRCPASYKLCPSTWKSPVQSQASVDPRGQLTTRASNIHMWMRCQQKGREKNTRLTLWWE